LIRPAKGIELLIEWSLMININFYPESDKEEYVSAAKEYSEIWKKDGIKIFNAIENFSGLKFKTKLINAVTFEGPSYSLPLRLRSSYPESHKKATLIHELCHRILVDNYFYIFDNKNLSEDIHKIIYLFLYDIWVDLLGKKIANESKDVEIGYGDTTYKNAWGWALSFDKEARKLKFKEMVEKYSNHPKAINKPKT